MFRTPRPPRPLCSLQACSRGTYAPGTPSCSPRQALPLLGSLVGVSRFCEVPSRQFSCGCSSLRQFWSFRCRHVSSPVRWFQSCCMLLDLLPSPAFAGCCCYLCLLPVPATRTCYSYLLPVPATRTCHSVARREHPTGLGIGRPLRAQHALFYTVSSGKQPWPGFAASRRRGAAPSSVQW